MLRRRRFHDPLAGPAGELGPVRDNHPVLGRDHVEPLGRLFADHMHRLLAARAVRVGRRDRLVNARQMGGQRAAVDPPFPRRIGGLRLLLDRLGLGDRLLEVFQRQIELIGMKLGQPLALRFEALRLAQQMTQAVVEFDQPVALGKRRIALGDGVQRQRPQRINIVGEESADRSTRQAQHMTGDLPEPNLRLIHFIAGYCTASGAGTRRARTRIQSRPSISAANCAADNRITPSSMRGQRNLPPSSLLANRHSPVPSQKISFTLSARLARKQKITPENGSAFNCSCTSAASPSIPLRKSTGFVATRTRIGPGGISIPPLMRLRAEPRARLLRRRASWRRPAPAP